MIVLPVEHEGQFLYAMLYEQLKAQIESGSLKVGDKLPSKRSLAAKLGVSINTVDTAYTQLELEGFVQARAKSGFYVLPIETLEKAVLSKRPAPQEKLPETADSVEIDFAPAAIAREKFPFSRWQRMMKFCLEQPKALLRTPPEGDPGLRAAVATYLYEERGVVCCPEQIIIGAGTDSLLEILGFILENRVALAVEDPVYNQAYRLFSRMGHQVIPAKMDKLGVMVEPLEQLDYLLLYTTPSHQYPLGGSMPVGRRTQLLNWAGRGEFRYIIEDDYDSEFRYDAKPVPSLQSIDQNERVIYLSFFSRSIAPGLRLSVMVLPPALLEIYHAQYAGFASRVSTIEQLTLGEFIRQGYFERHLNRMKTYYKNKCNRLLQGLRPLQEQMELVGEMAGQHLTLALKNGLEEDDLCRRASEVGVKVYPVSPFYILPPERCNMVLLGFAGLGDQELDEGTRRLVSVWKL